MKSTIAQEFRDVSFSGILQEQKGATVTWESPRLTTMYPRLGVPKGSDRAVCRTVNGVLQVKILDRSLLLGGNSGVSVTAGLWGEFNKSKGVLVSTKYYLDGRYANDLILPDPAISPITRGYGIPMFNSNGVLGFNAWNSFSNHAQNIYIRLSFVKDVTYDIATGPIPIKILCSGVLLAADPA
jgi:hypothetical protein